MLLNSTSFCRFCRRATINDILDVQMTDFSVVVGRRHKTELITKTLISTDVQYYRKCSFSYVLLNTKHYILKASKKKSIINSIL